MNVLADSLKVVIAILIAFAVGWFFLYDDIKALKSDIRALKAYLRSTPVPDQCLPPGQQESSKSCYYKLQITDDKDKDKGLFSAKIDLQVFKDNAKDCPQVNQSLLEEYKALAYDCPPLDLDFNKPTYHFPDKDIVYTFQVDGTHPLGITAGQSYHFLSVSGTKHLRKIEKAPSP